HPADRGRGAGAWHRVGARSRRPSCAAPPAQRRCSASGRTARTAAAGSSGATPSKRPARSATTAAGWCRTASRSAPGAVATSPTETRAPSRSKPPRGSSTIDADRKSTRLNSSHVAISYAVFCLTPPPPPPPLFPYTTLFRSLELRPPARVARHHQRDRRGVLLLRLGGVGQLLVLPLVRSRHRRPRLEPRAAQSPQGVQVPSTLPVGLRRRRDVPDALLPLVRAPAEMALPGVSEHLPPLHQGRERL